MMYSSSPRKRPIGFVLAILIVVLGGVVIWLLHHRYAKTDEVFAPAKLEQSSVDSPVKRARHPLLSSTPQLGQAHTQSLGETKSTVSAESNSTEVTDTVQALQTQVQTLKQQLSEAQEALSRQTEMQSQLKAAQSEVARLKKALRDQQPLTAQDQAATQPSTDKASGAPVVAILDAGTKTDSAMAQDASSSDEEDAPAHAVFPIVRAKAGILTYLIDVTDLDRKVLLSTPIRVQYVLQYQLSNGNTAYKVLGYSSSTVKQTTRLQGQWTYQSNTTPVKLRVVVSSANRYLFDRTYTISR